MSPHKQMARASSNFRKASYTEEVSPTAFGNVSNFLIKTSFSEINYHDSLSKIVNRKIEFGELLDF